MGDEFYCCVGFVVGYVVVDGCFDFGGFVGVELVEVEVDVDVVGFVGCYVEGVVCYVGDVVFIDV